MHLIYPMFAMVVLSAVVLARLFRARSRAVARGEVDPRYFKTYQGGEEPRHARQLSRHFSNVFEAPVLFYVVCLAAMQMQLSGLLIISLAWAYVAIRVVHAIIHTGGNRIMPRVWAYFASWVVLMVMWVLVVVHVAGVGS